MGWPRWAEGGRPSKREDGRWQGTPARLGNGVAGMDSWQGAMLWMYLSLANQRRLKWSERWLTQGGVALSLTMPWRFVLAIWLRRCRGKEYVGYTQMEIRENENKGKWMGPWVGFWRVSNQTEIGVFKFFHKLILNHLSFQTFEHNLKTI